MRVLCAAACLLAACAAVAAQEQDAPRNNEVGVIIGRTFVSSQTVPNTNFAQNKVLSGKGLTFDFDYAHRLHNFNWGSIAAELPIIYNTDEDLNYGQNVIPQDYTSIFVTPAARVSFLPDLAFSPWVSLGGGFGHFESSKDLVFFGAYTGPRVKNTGVLHTGIGLDIRMPWWQRFLRFRVEARDNWSGVPAINLDTGRTRQHNYYLGGGVVYRFF